MGKSRVHGLAQMNDPEKVVDELARKKRRQKFIL